MSSAGRGRERQRFNRREVGEIISLRGIPPAIGRGGETPGQSENKCRHPLGMIEKQQGCGSQFQEQNASTTRMRVEAPLFPEPPERDTAWVTSVLALGDPKQ